MRHRHIDYGIVWRAFVKETYAARRLLDAKEAGLCFNLEFFNLAVSGNFTKRVLNRLKQETKSRSWGDEPMLFIFAVGINDAHLSDGQGVSAPDTYRQDLEALYYTAKELSDDMIFVGLTPVREAETRPWVFNAGTHSLEWSNDRIHLFDGVLKDFT